MNILRRPKLEYTLQHLKQDKSRLLKRNLTWIDIAVLGVSMSVGAGIFSVGARVITEHAGPAAIISFLIAAIICALAAMCYAEFASAIPVAGSAYTFSYFTLGEVIAWIVGFNLILELFMASAVIVKYWSIYLYTSLRLLGLWIPGQIRLGFIELDWTIFVAIAIFTVLLVVGTKFSSRITSVFVVIKIGVIIFIIVNGFMYFNWENLLPFIPDSQSVDVSAGLYEQSLLSTISGVFTGLSAQSFGVSGIFTGAAIIFFAFLGFDNAATAAEETVNPQRNVPIGLFVGIGVVSLLYILTAISTVGMVPISAYDTWKNQHPGVSISLATAFEINGQSNIGAIASIGAFVGLTTVVIIALLGLSRIVFAMSRDGLIQRSLSQTSRFQTPHRIQILTGVLVALVAAFSSVEVLADMVNIGTLSAFILVAFAIPVLRRRQLEVLNNDQTKSNAFRVPFSPYLPVVTGVLCIWLSVNLSIGTWIMFAIWVGVGLVFYFIYGRRNSELAKHPDFVDR
jgi:APA family basic amino acid/polyamine antiporter